MTLYDASKLYAVVDNIALYFGDDRMSVECARVVAGQLLMLYTQDETADLLVIGASAK